MERFIENEGSNYVQLYFEEAHNLFPKKDDKDLSQIYNRIAKEGAKLRLGLIYATQEVSSISGNVLKNTQNWFVAHLNNEDELREVKKYYDFEDFVESLRRAPDGLHPDEDVLQRVRRPGADRPVLRRRGADGLRPVKGRRPFERASKIAHTHVLNNPDVQEFVSKRASCRYRPDAKARRSMRKAPYPAPTRASTRHRGGRGDDEVAVRKEFPTAPLPS